MQHWVQQSGGELLLRDLTPNRVVSDYYGPSGFHWMAPGLLGGAARPGVLADFNLDLEALARVGTRLLVCLTEEWTPDPDAVADHGMDSLYVPIPDQYPPELNQAAELCRVVDARIEAGEAVVHHCHAGKGRTGTLLVAQLIWRGAKAGAALDWARARNRKWVESEAQEQFLFDFEEFCRMGGANTI